MPFLAIFLHFLAYMSAFFINIGRVMMTYGAPLYILISTPPHTYSKIVNYDGVWFYPKVKVKSIYLGCKVSEKNKKLIESKCAALNIPVHHLSIRKGNNKLIVDD